MRAVFCAGGLVAALAALAGAGRLWAEVKDGKATKTPAPRTRVALVNFNYVIKNYHKYKDYQDQLQEASKTYQERDKKLRAQGEKLTKGMGNGPIVPARSDDIEEKLKKIQREIEDNGFKAKKALGKLNDEAMKTIFEDLISACEGYAAAHEFDLVLHYSDALNREECLSTPNIARKLQTGALMPVYTAPGLDISKEVVQVLNYQHKQKKDEEP